MESQQQLRAATEAMTQWLSHPSELGHKPAGIMCGGTFQHDGMTYYIFRFRKNKFDRKWLIGVAGGYEGDSLENCGHVFSRMEEYRESDAEKAAIDMVETVKAFWRQKAEEVEERKQNPGVFIGFVLLEHISWDREKLLADLKEKWGIEDKPTGPKPVTENEDELCIIELDGAFAAVTFLPGPVPNREAEAAAQANFFWQDAAETAARHKAHLMVTVMPRGMTPIESGQLSVKLLDACCMQAGALGVYSNGVVYEPSDYAESAAAMREGQIPAYDMVWVGLFRNDTGDIMGYTNGMLSYGYDEMEIITGKLEPKEVFMILSTVCAYVLTEGKELKDGDTFAFDESIKLKITRSHGVFVPGESLKIEY